MTPADPPASLERQIERLQRRLARLERISTRYAWIRLAIAAGGLIVGGLVGYVAGPWPAALTVAAALLLFGLALYGHRRVEDSLARHGAWLRIKQAHLARASLDWERIPAGFYLQPQPDHSFEADLDIVGERSLHRLLDTAVSLEGSHRLRAWLADPAPDPDQTLRRQRRVRELVGLPLFRDKLAMHAALGLGGGKVWRAAQLTGWLDRGAAPASLGRWLLGLGLLAALNALLLAANRLAGLPPWWPITFALYAGLTLVRWRSTAGVWDEARLLQGALQQLRAVFRHLESFSCAGRPHLAGVCAPFHDPERRPSRYLARIARVVAALGVRGNPLLHLAVNAILPWDFLFAWQLERTKRDLARHAPAWMDAWFELEALSSLANFAGLNPGYAFPEIRTGPDAGSGAVLSARALGHPLIPAGARVTNDYTITDLGRVSIITGSNMAGKSVFLKTVGLAAALAGAGGPVCARWLEMLPCRLFASMAVADSVTGGISYFYAEVRRLKSLLGELERAKALPLLFCIDEIFRGTNNRERLAGARAYVRALVGKNGAGLIATHDLELARLADEDARITNYHFRDSVDDGRMVFDYTLRPGPSPTTNALKIMRLHGLPVPTPDEAPPA